MIKKTKKKSTHSIVPVIFTLGVIGWGFFAIDRLTSPSAPEQGWNSQVNTSHNQGSSQSSWKRSLKGFLSSFAGSGEESQNSQKVSDAPASIPIMPEPQFQQQEAQAPTPQKSFESPEKQYTKKAYIYFYREHESQELSLEKSAREFKSASLKELFTALIHGPSSGELNYNFLDSFPVKPTLLEARREGSIIVLDFDDNFGLGVSFETLDLQIKQLYHTARQFQGVDSIQILIDGRSIEHAGSDGLVIPKIINEQSWPIAMN